MTDPKPGNNISKLRAWAVSGPGAAHFKWGTPGDFDRCQVFYKGKIPDAMIPGWCANLHKAATGATPGNAPGEKRDKS